MKKSSFYQRTGSLSLGVILGTILSLAFSTKISLEATVSLGWLLGASAGGLLSGKRLDLFGWTLILGGFSGLSLSFVYSWLSGANYFFDNPLARWGAIFGQILALFALWVSIIRDEKR